MKKLIWLLVIMLPLGLWAQDEVQQSREIAQLGYIDMSQDVVSGSDISFMKVNDKFLTSINAAYDYGFRNKKLGVFISYTTMGEQSFLYDYKRIGLNYGSDRTMKNGATFTSRVTMFVSTYDDNWEYAYSFTQLMFTPKYKIGYSAYVQQYTNVEFTDEFGYFEPQQRTTDFRIMFIGIRYFRIGKWSINPEVFASTILANSFTTVGYEPTDPIYFKESSFNPPDNWNYYFGTGIEYYLTNRFSLGVKFRGNYNIDPGLEDEGTIEKPKPFIFTLGASYDF